MDFDTTAADLHAAIAAVCPIHGVSIGRKDDKATWRIDFAPEASKEQKTAAAAAMAGFDVQVARVLQEEKRATEERIALRMRELAILIDRDPTILDRLKGV
jgi:hypothetical protein